MVSRGSSAVLVVAFAVPVVAGAQEGMFVRGDANDSGVVDIGDAVCGLIFLFGDVQTPCGEGCEDALDANDDGERIGYYVWAGTVDDWQDASNFCEVWLV